MAQLPLSLLVVFAVATALLSIAGIYGFLVYGPFGLRAGYDRDVARILASRHEAPTLTEDDVSRLPEPVQRYLRVAGVIGQPRVRNFYARMHGRIRSAPDAPWMPFSAEQYNAVDGAGGGSRFFYMTATRAGIPMQGYHRYAAGAATMRVKVAGAITVVRLSGPAMTRAETVTLFNDLCVLAPGALVDADVVWERVEPGQVTAAFTNAGITIHADLIFAHDGHLLDFWSGDRMRTSEDGATLIPDRWSTALRGARRFGGVQLAAGGEARWNGAAGSFAYIELELDEVAYNRRHR